MKPTEIWAYEMYIENIPSESPSINLIPFSKSFFDEYMNVYNECFYPMRKALDIEPYNWYSSYSQIEDKAKDIFVYFADGKMIGSVACYGNEIDDLIVRQSEQGKGYGKKLLLWALNHIRESNSDPITLHVAECNKGALKLYENTGFKVKSKEKVR